MPTFRPGDIVKVPFPYTDRATRQSRPAFVLVHLEDHDLLWVAMITSAENRRWSQDVALLDHQAAGLPAPSIVRAAKIATLDAADATLLGAAPPTLLAEVLQVVRRILGQHEE
jgi:mRNA interferase MazF